MAATAPPKKENTTTVKEGSVTRVVGPIGERDSANFNPGRGAYNKQIEGHTFVVNEKGDTIISGQKDQYAGYVKTTKLDPATGKYVDSWDAPSRTGAEATQLEVDRLEAKYPGYKANQQAQENIQHNIQMYPELGGRVPVRGRSSEDWQSLGYSKEYGDEQELKVTAQRYAAYTGRPAGDLLRELKLEAGQPTPIGIQTLKQDLKQDVQAGIPGPSMQAGIRAMQDPRNQTLLEQRIKFGYDQGEIIKLFAKDVASGRVNDPIGMKYRTLDKFNTVANIDERKLLIDTTPALKEKFDWVRRFVSSDKEARDIVLRDISAKEMRQISKDVKYKSISEARAAASKEGAALTPSGILPKGTYETLKKSEFRFEKEESGAETTRPGGYTWTNKFGDQGLTVLKRGSGLPVKVGGTSNATTWKLVEGGGAMAGDLKPESAIREGVFRAYERNQQRELTGTGTLAAQPEKFRFAVKGNVPFSEMQKIPEDVAVNVVKGAAMKEGTFAKDEKTGEYGFSRTLTPEEFKEQYPYEQWRNTTSGAKWQISKDDESTTNINKIDDVKNTGDEFLAIVPIGEDKYAISDSSGKIQDTVIYRGQTMSKSSMNKMEAIDDAIEKYGHSYDIPTPGVRKMVNPVFEYATQEIRQAELDRVLGLDKAKTQTEKDAVQKVYKEKIAYIQDPTKLNIELEKDAFAPKYATQTYETLRAGGYSKLTSSVLMAVDEATQRVNAGDVPIIDVSGSPAAMMAITAVPIALATAEGVASQIGLGVYSEVADVVTQVTGSTGVGQIAGAVAGGGTQGLLKPSEIKFEAAVNSKVSNIRPTLKGLYDNYVYAPYGAKTDWQIAKDAGSYVKTKVENFIDKRVFAKEGSKTDWQQTVDDVQSLKNKIVSAGDLKWLETPVIDISTKAAEAESRTNVISGERVPSKVDAIFKSGTSEVTSRVEPLGKTVAGKSSKFYVESTEPTNKMAPRISGETDAQYFDRLKRIYEGKKVSPEQALREEASKKLIEEEARQRNQKIIDVSKDSELAKKIKEQAESQSKKNKAAEESRKTDIPKKKKLTPYEKSMQESIEKMKDTAPQKADELIYGKAKDFLDDAPPVRVVEEKPQWPFDEGKKSSGKTTSSNNQQLLLKTEESAKGDAPQKTVNIKQETQAEVFERMRKNAEQQAMKDKKIAERLARDSEEAKLRAKLREEAKAKRASQEQLKKNKVKLLQALSFNIDSGRLKYLVVPPKLEQTRASYTSPKYDTAQKQTSKNIQKQIQQIGQKQKLDVGSMQESAKSIGQNALFGAAIMMSQSSGQSSQQRYDYKYITETPTTQRSRWGGGSPPAGSGSGAGRGRSRFSALASLRKNPIKSGAEVLASWSQKGGSLDAQIKTWRKK